MRKFSVLCLLFLDTFGLAVIYPIFTPLVLKTNLVTVGQGFDARGLLLALLICAFPLGQLFGAPTFGSLADKYSCRFAFTLSLLGEFAGFIFTAIAVHYLLYWPLLVARLWTGFFAGNLTVGMAAISEMSSDRRSRTRNFGQIASVTGFAFVIAVLLGGVLSNRVIDKVFTPSLPFYLAAALTLINLVLIRKAFYDEPKNASGTKYTPLSHRIRWFYLVYFFFMLGWITVLQFLSAFSIERLHIGKTQITWIFALIGIVWLIGNSGFNRFLVKWLSGKMLVIFAIGLLSLTIFGASLSPNTLYFSILVSLAALFASIVWVNIMSMISTSALLQNQGRAIGYSQSVAMLAMMGGSIVGGSLASFGTQTIYLTSASCLLAGFLVSVIIYKYDKS